MNLLHDGRSKCLPQVMMMSARADNHASGRDQIGRSNPFSCLTSAALCLCYILSGRLSALMLSASKRGEGS